MAVSAKTGNRTGKGGRIIAALLALCVIGAGIYYALLPKEVEAIEVTGIADGDELYIGEEITPEYTVLPDRFSEEPVTTATSDPDVLAVDEEGKFITGVPGTATITLTAKEFTEELEITVVPKVTAIKGIDEKIEMTTGNTFTLEPVLKPEKFADEPVTYSSDDKKIVKVSKKGELTAVAAGTAKITVSAGGTSIKSTVNVTDPVVVYNYDSGSSGSSSKKSSKSSKASKGYFDSSDDEEF